MDRLDHALTELCECERYRDQLIGSLRWALRAKRHEVVLAGRCGPLPVAQAVKADADQFEHGVACALVGLDPETLKEAP